jgi:hypothetical protein
MMTIMRTVRLAAVVYESGFQIDEFLTRAANLLRAENIRLGGVLQENERCAAGSCAAMTLIDLTSQSRFRISQDLGPLAQGCRLDARGLMEIGVLLDRTIDGEVELLVLNKFGKAEAEGGGLRSAFVRAIESGIPVVTAVKSTYTEAWTQFHGGLAIDLAPDLGRVRAWCADAVRELRAARRTELSPTG